MSGALALVGGDEFRPGNEPHDRLLVKAAGGRPAYVVATAARDNPDAAVRTARRWFARIGLDIAELRIRTPADARSDAIATEANGAGLIYIAGGDPGYLVRVLHGSRAWAAIRDAWRAGCAVAGSSAGAMALCQWALIRAAWPGHTNRRPATALGVVPGCALLPHYDTFGQRWIPSAQRLLGAETLLIGVDERTASVQADGVWRVYGAGRVTLVRGEKRSSFAAGDVLEGMPTPAAAPPAG
jgi:cyanophycinase